MAVAGGEVRRAIVVAAEASVHPMFIASFQRLGVLAPPGEGCRPFDRDRAGFVMTEAAAAVCLERSDDGGRALVRVNRFALGGDGMHITAGDATGTNLRRLLKIVLAGQSVDLIHAHGTGTVLNDPVEIAAMESVLANLGEKNAVAADGHRFVREPGRPRPGPQSGYTGPPRDSVSENGSDRPFIYSHKGALGHSLGASGLISIVLNCRAHQADQFPGNVRTGDPLPMDRMQIHQQPVAAPIRRSIAIATGFGGPTAVVGLESIQALIEPAKR
jgi:3-oxoacyl-[acyl-carrier-protein] synthase II